MALAAPVAIAQEQLLIGFGDRNGQAPDAPVILDQSGNLYGTTVYGGPLQAGLVYQLVPGGGGWTQNVLHSFLGGSDGANPYGGLVRDAAGNLYGTTAGTIFRLAPLTPTKKNRFSTSYMHNYTYSIVTTKCSTWNTSQILD